MKPYKLYLTNRSPYARKIRVALLEKKISFDEIIVNLAEKPAELWQANPGGTVPALVTPDGLCLSDSTVMLHYLEQNCPEPPLVPQDKKNYWLAWNVEELADRICDLNVAVFFERQKKDPREDVFFKAQKVTAEVLAYAETILQDKDYLFGDYSLADIALACALNWMTFRLQIDYKSQSQNFQNWLKRVNERESFLKTIPKLD